MGTEDRNITSEVEAVLEQYVRPALSAHGGDMEVAGVEGGVVFFRAANIQRERAPRGRAGPATTPSHKFFLHESLPIPFLSWRFQSFRHKSRIFKSIHN